MRQRPVKGPVPLAERLRRLEPRLKTIQAITGIPGFSIGVIHQGVEVWKFNSGYCDVENKIPPRSDTVFNLNSLTKSITSAAFACLVHDGKVNWDTPIKAILPDFAQGCDAIDQEINAIDLLSMRSGHQSLNCLPWQGNNIVLPDRRDTINSGTRHLALGISAISSATTIGVLPRAPIWAIGTKAHQDAGRDSVGEQFPFVRDAGRQIPVLVPGPTIGAGIFTEGGSGVLSTIDDMLALYKTYLDAINDQFRSGTKSTPGNPFVECATLVAAHNRLPAKSILREQSYGCGWIRCQLPGPLGMIGMNNDFVEMPHVLEGGPSHLCLYHMGMMVGSTSNIALLPETDTVVALLANAAPLGDGTDWMSQMIIEEIFEPPTRHNFGEYAEKVASKILNHIPSLGKELEERRIPDTVPSSPIESYAGGFVHDKTPFKIDIRFDEEKGA
ncbi:unnamed protein product [Parascedosporium putredinis]|uniref:Beta-lactamase-related domain-containing protein n=1 Tax=Parascedosporium putredinis TaxID=1442378 RepID=A0A9P1H4N3_9PEZI|nr:unnamed protein product [Parascedosporium putredinis]CAI7996940.1 unnamed protein product [Parascedosporium putredinis]